jgi:membrane protein implicated in regulation of membrane protease activity
MTDLYGNIAIISSVLLGIIILLNIIGIDLDTDVDFHLDMDFFSVNSLVAFFCVGGWTGYLANLLTPFQQWVIAAIAVAAGLTTYVGSILILRRLKGWESSGNIDLNNAIGKTGKVYLGIPEDGEGQVQIVIQGRLKTLKAITHGKSIETGENVIVYDIEKNKLVVEIYNPDI